MTQYILSSTRCWDCRRPLMAYVPIEGEFDAKAACELAQTQFFCDLCAIERRAENNPNDVELRTSLDSSPSH